MTRVLIASDWYSPAVNGVVTSILTLQEHLERQGHQVRILTLSPNRHSHVEGSVHYLGSFSANLVYRDARISVPIRPGIMRDLADWAPDVVHTQCEFTTFQMARRLCNTLDIPLVHTYHTVYEDYTHYFSPNRAMGRRMAAAFTRSIIEKTDMVIAPTAKVARLLTGYGVSTPIRVVPTGVDLNRYDLPPDLAKQAQLRARLGIPAGNRVLLYLGRLAREKNLAEILGYLGKIRPANTTLLLVGDGPYRERLQNLVSELRLDTMVVFAGQVPQLDTVHYYQLADLFVSASRSETQGLTYIEALAAGCPTLCREDPSIEGVVVDGLNGWQYETFDAFRNHLATFLEDPQLRQQLSDQARLWAQQRFSADSFASSVAEVYAEAVLRRRELVLT